MSGPLTGIRVVELAGIGPGPHGAMMLADWGADVVRVVRPGPTGAPDDLVGDPQLRNRTLVAADLKNPEHVAAVLDLVRRADVLIEGFRPGVTEELGLGPEDCTVVNERLVYARMTGWGQFGPRAHTAGHDINYLSITGMLHAIGEPHRPSVPLNLLGDYGGGSTFLVSSILAALVERGRTGRGQVLDIAIADGIATLAQHIWFMRAMGVWSDRRMDNMLDGGAPYYGVYECADGGFVAVGAMEHKFSALLFDMLGLDTAILPSRDDQGAWPALRSILADSFASRTRDEWAALFDGTDACVTPVLTMSEAHAESHMRARDLYGETDGKHHTMPAPIFSTAVLEPPTPPNSRIAELADVVAAWDS